MIHQDLKIHWIDDVKGYGLVATKPIPKGTITFVQDGLDIVIEQSDPRLADLRISEAILKYTYTDAQGNSILSWDHGKYMNHSCEANTLSTGYGFEIAVEDIAPGQEATDDYRIFSSNWEGESWLRSPLCSFEQEESLESLIQYWDQKIKGALALSQDVSQPLADLIEESIWHQLKSYLEGTHSYLSVATQLTRLTGNCDLPDLHGKNIALLASSSWQKLGPRPA